jgi:hypothetical protein
MRIEELVTALMVELNDEEMLNVEGGKDTSLVDLSLVELISEKNNSENITRPSIGIPKPVIPVPKPVKPIMQEK